MRARPYLGMVALAGAVLVGCGDDEDPVGTTQSSDPTTTEAGGSPSSTSAAAAPDFPPALDALTHGGKVWAVVLAAATETEAPILQQAEAAAAAASYTVGPTDCDVGAPELLGLEEPPAVYTLSVYFSSETDAQTALDAFRQSGWEGGAVGQVETFCLD